MEQAIVQHFALNTRASYLRLFFTQNDEIAASGSAIDGCGPPICRRTRINNIRVRFNTELSMTPTKVLSEETLSHILESLMFHSSDVI